MLARAVDEDPAADDGGAFLGRGDLGGRGDSPARFGAGNRRRAAIHRPRTDLGHRLLYERARGLRRSVGVVDARLPPVVVGLVRDVENQEAAHSWLAG